MGLPSSSHRGRGAARRRIAGAVVCLLGVCLTGCSPTTRTSHTPASATDLSTFGEGAGPVVSGGENGLEVRWWTFLETDGEIGAALAQYDAQDAGLPEEVRQSWRRHGLRLIRMSLDEYLDVQRALPSSGRIDRYWLGQTHAWTELVKGPTSAGEQAFAVNGSLLFMKPGRLRLITRAWTAPTTAGPRIRTDLVVQHVENRRPDPSVAFMPPTGRDVDEEGMTLRGLTARLDLEPGWAYVLVPERPDAEWGEDDEEVDDDVSLMVQGPRVRPPLTPGEAMMRRTLPESERATMKAIVVLLPRTSGVYRLLP
ncbi:MAG: hypothetical protein EA376_11850 [Phycisphaeraceae bacterium]|nr:MAG: hypothetical protein EA376_11850 [Phycisphaeraceae bacterium]